MPIFSALAGVGAGVLGALGVAGPVTAASATVAGLSTAAAVGAAGYGAYKGVEALSGGKPAAPSVAPIPSAPALAPAPTPETAQNAAQAAIEKQKRMRMLSGGKTILSSESPTLSSTTGGKSLLGS